MRRAHGLALHSAGPSTPHLHFKAKLIAESPELKKRKNKHMVKTFGTSIKKMEQRKAKPLATKMAELANKRIMSFPLPFSF